MFGCGPMLRCCCSSITGIASPQDPHRLAWLVPEALASTALAEGIAHEHDVTPKPLPWRSSPARTFSTPCPTAPTRWAPPTAPAGSCRWQVRAALTWQLGLCPRPAAQIAGAVSPAVAAAGTLRQWAPWRADSWLPRGLGALRCCARGLNSRPNALLQASGMPLTPPSRSALA